MEAEPTDYFGKTDQESLLFTSETLSDVRPGDIKLGIFLHQATCAINPENKKRILLCDKNSKAALSVKTKPISSFPSHPGSFSHFVNVAHSICNFQVASEKPSQTFSARDIDEALGCAVKSYSVSMQRNQNDWKSKWKLKRVSYDKNCAAFFQPTAEPAQKPPTKASQNTRHDYEL